MFQGNKRFGDCDDKTGATDILAILRKVNLQFSTIILCDTCLYYAKPSSNEWRDILARVDVTIS
jgi:hypothetical protein